MKNIGLIIIFTLLTPGFLSRPRNPGVSIEVAFWGSVEEIKIIRKTVEEWEKNHPQIRVKLQHIPTGGYLQKILTRIAGGNPPDIIFSEVNDFVYLKSKGIFLDLMPFIRKDKEFDLNRYFPEILERFREGDKLYLLPRDIAPFACIYYNQDLFQKENVPLPTDDWDWFGLLERAKRLTLREGDRVKRYGFYTIFWENFVYSAGGSLVDDPQNPTRLTLDSPKSKEGLRFYLDLIHKYRVMPSPESMLSLQMNAVQMFMMGKLAMYGSGIWETPIFRKIRNFTWDVVMFPRGPKGKRAFGSGGSGYGILRTTPHPEEAWEVLKCLTGKRAEEILAQSGLAQPADMFIARGPLFAGSILPPRNKKMLNTAVRYIIFEPNHPRWKEARGKYLDPILELVFNGELSLEEGLKKAKERINPLLSSP